MRKLTISEGLIIGHKRIDAEHEQIANCVNKAFEMNESGNADECMKCCYELVGLLVNHFRSEEEIMEEIGFYDLEAHKKIHYDGLLKFSDLIRNAGYGHCDEQWENDVISLVLNDLLHADLKIKDFLLKIDYRE